MCGLVLHHMQALTRLVCTAVHTVNAPAVRLPFNAQYWAAHIEEAQAPNPLLSARDGRLIKPVPSSQRLSPEDLQAHLQAALYPLQDEVRRWGCTRAGWCGQQ